jgi:hypothetical protein
VIAKAVNSRSLTKRKIATYNSWLIVNEASYLKILRRGHGHFGIPK